MRQTSVERLHGRLDVLQTSFPPPPSWIHDGDAGNDVIQDLGRVFRAPLRRRRKMAALPLPVAILGDLIPGTGNWEWGHPRWRPEAEGPPSCASASMGLEKPALYYWHQPEFRKLSFFLLFSAWSWKYLFTFLLFLKLTNYYLFIFYRKLLRFNLIKCH